MGTIYLLVILFGAFVDSAPGPAVTISPAHAHIRLQPGSREDVNVTCTSPSRIAECQFKVGARPPVDTLRGTNGDQTAGVEFAGEAGRCRVTLSWKTFGLDGTYEEVGCRVRQAAGDWGYATMSVYGSSRSGLALNVTPSQVVAAPGEAVSVLVVASTPLVSCSVLHDHAWLTLDDSSVPCREGICYHGAGLARGECGVTLPNVSDRDNGNLWLRVKDLTLAEGIGLVPVVVTKPPQAITVKYKVTTDEGGALTLTAWCSVIGGRPTAELAWFIAGELVTEAVASVPGAEWAWPRDERTVNQSLTRKLSAADGGKEVTCTATLHGGKTLSDAKLLPSFGIPDVDVVSKSPETMAIDEESGENAHQGLAAGVLFGVAIFLYVVVLAIGPLTAFAWQRELCCFKRHSYESGASLDTDVMDYHASRPADVTLREDSRAQTYLEPIQRLDSYFMPAPESSRTSTLGPTQPRKAKPLPRHVQTTAKKQKSNSSAPKAAHNSLFMPTPVDQLLDQLGAPGDSPAADGDEVPIYGNIFPDPRSEPVYVNLGDASGQDVDAHPEDPVYGNVHQHSFDDGRVYGNF